MSRQFVDILRADWLLRLPLVTLVRLRYLRRSAASPQEAAGPQAAAPDRVDLKRERGVVRKKWLLHSISVEDYTAEW